jgi:SAM-dependent methyltransferase
MRKLRRRLEFPASDAPQEDSIQPTPEELLFPGDHLPVRDGTVLNLHVDAGPGRLVELFTQYGSDKGWVGDAPTPWPWPPHNYADIYELLLAPRRRSARIVLECGIGSNRPEVRSNMSSTGMPGASLRAWRDYFPAAEIIGIDIDPESLFSEDRIRTALVDQTDPKSIADFLASERIGQIDVVIDDGLHEFHAGRTLFNGIFPVLAESGIYIIEDVGDDDLIQYREFFAERRVLAAFLRIHRPGLPIGDNSLIVVQAAC